MNVDSIGLVILLLSAPLAAQIPEPDSLQRKQEEQQRATAMTRDLLTNVLDLQLRQLEENQLTDLDVYREIQLMRDHLSAVIETEMTNVVEILAAAQSQSQAERETTLSAARQRVREIVHTLSAERQNLLRRLKIAELAEQVRRLITLQSKVQTATKQLTAEAKALQETLTLKLVEDQRDVKELYLLLIDTLTDVRTWGGNLSHAAADGVKLLQAANVSHELDQAGQALRSTRFAEAVMHQDATIRTLQELLKLTERAQGVMGAENQSAIQQIQEIARQQHSLREETRQQDSSTNRLDALVERQTRIQQELHHLKEAIAAQPAAETQLEHAKASAVAATDKLFESQREQAVLEQTKVLGHLAALQSVLKEVSADSLTDRSAVELAQMVRELEQTRRQLATAQQNQEEAAQQAAINAQAAAQPLAQAATLLDEAMKNQKLPAPLVNRLEDAQDAAAAAVKDLAQAAAEPAKAPQQGLVERAENALDRAIAATATALEDAQRRQAAIQIGELARAAEVLERAAAEERDIANAAETIASQEETGDFLATAERAKSAAERQTNVANVAERIASGLEPTSPQSALVVADGRNFAQQAEQELLKAAEHAADSAAAAKSEASAAAQLAKSSAEKFAAAAQQLRTEIARSADQLVEASETQANRLQAAVQSVEQTLRTDGSSLLDRLEQLAQAQTNVSAATQQQLIAAGKPAAAQAMNLVQIIATTIRSQDQASKFAEDARELDDISPVRAAIAQQEIVEQTLEAAKLAMERPQVSDLKKAGKTDSLIQALQAAQTQAQDAGRKLIDGEEAAAKANQNAAQAALKSALALADTELRDALKAPATQTLNRSAQDQSTQFAEAARKFASKDAPAAADSLASAVDAGKLAGQQLSQGQPDQAIPAQQQSMQSLREAERMIQAAMDQLTTAQGQQLQEQAQRAEQLGKETSGLDLGAAEAIAAAKHAAKRGSKPNATPQQRSMSSQRVQQNLERAAANLTTRDQSVRRDQTIAAALSELAAEQQAAAEVLADQRETMSEDGAVAAVAEAAENFSTAQQALGQGAVELSGQAEVANQPLREALELASKFPSLQALGEDLHRMPMDAAHGEMPAENVAGNAPDQTSVDRPDNDVDAKDDTPQNKPADDAESQAIQPPLDLGTSFVPKSPEITAKMMAGPKAREAMQAAESQRDNSTPSRRSAAKANKKSALANKLSRADKSALQADGDDVPPGAESLDTSEFSANNQNSSTDNSEVKDGPIQKMNEGTKVAEKRGQSSAGDDAARALRNVHDAPWFAKLPPELRKSIRTNSQQRPPRAYEDRLRRYFESVD